MAWVSDIVGRKALPPITVWTWADTVSGLIIGSSRPTTTGFPNPMTVKEPACFDMTEAANITSARASIPPPEKRIVIGRRRSIKAYPPFVSANMQIPRGKGSSSRLERLLRVDKMNEIGYFVKDANNNGMCTEVTDSAANSRKGV